MRIMDLQTPARLYAVTETESAYGGRTFSTVPGATVWGDFRPGVPGMKTTSEGDSYVVQAAELLCRSADGVAAGGLLNLKGYDWRIVSIDALADGTVRLSIERVHG